MSAYDFSTAYPDILVLVGTRTGNAEIVAEHVAGALRPCGFAVRVVSMIDAAPADLDAADQLIVCTSTHGEGDLPDTAVDFYAALEAERPALGHLAYGVVALGDRYYDNFAQGGQRFRDLLDALGAVEVIASHEIDQGPRPDQLRAVAAWALACAAAFAAAFAPDEDEAAG